ncbi:hypothetical protein POM88_042167 [Heracleum sosnowskyi]|uniref:Pentatricopeptide repeat-containing protein n=1 Tax=Heracleum sosnowskyi TaxID=360622 RepID=A0AAD8HGA8_9APIA|nr:hypothetical protein POM88_042167 [Heracleum sosnowskyi]
MLNTMRSNMIAPDSYSILINGYCKKQNVDKALDLLRIMLVKSLKPLLNDNDWRWKNRCFSDDLWLKMWKNTIYSGCLNTILQIQWDKYRQCEYNDKEWEEMCEQIQNHDSEKFHDKLPNMWNWKELNYLWDVVDRCDGLYTTHMHGRTLHPSRSNFSCFMNHLCLSTISCQIENYNYEEFFGSGVLSWKNRGRYCLLSIGKGNQDFVNDRAAIPFSRS